MNFRPKPKPVLFLVRLDPITTIVNKFVNGAAGRCWKENPELRTVMSSVRRFPPPSPPATGDDDYHRTHGLCQSSGDPATARFDLLQLIR